MGCRYLNLLGQWAVTASVASSAVFLLNTMWALVTRLQALCPTVLPAHVQLLVAGT